MELIEETSNSADKTKHAIVVLIDLKKAFNIVNPKILIKKINFYGA